MDKDTGNNEENASQHRQPCIPLEDYLTTWRRRHDLSSLELRHFLRPFWCSCLPKASFWLGSAFICFFAERCFFVNDLFSTDLLFFEYVWAPSTPPVVSGEPLCGPLVCDGYITSKLARPCGGRFAISGPPLLSFGATL